MAPFKKDETKEEKQMARKKRTRNQINKNEDRKEKPGTLRTYGASGTRKSSPEGTVWLAERISERKQRRKSTGARPGTGTS